MCAPNALPSWKYAWMRSRRYPTMNKRSWTPFSTSAWTTYSRSGRFPTGIMTFGSDAVKGPIRAPSPAARMTAFIGRPPLRAPDGRRIHAAGGICLAGPVHPLRTLLVRGLRRRARRMVRRWLVEDTPQGAVGREAEILEKPERVAPLSSPLAWRILQELARAPDYPNALAARLNIHEQKVYYHVRRLERAGLLEVLREESKRGASARVLAPTAEAFAIVLKGRGKPVASPLLPHAGIVARFLEEFSSEGTFNGSIVVGSPYTHGPFSTTSRDSPYAVELGFFLGRLFAAPKRPLVRLDTELKAAGPVRDHLILVGGPVAN